MEASHNSSDNCFPQFRLWLQFVPWAAIQGSPRCAERRFSGMIRAERCWPIDWKVFWRSWRHSRYTWRWWPMSWNLGRGEHLRPTIITLVEVISLLLWPISWKSLACAGGWLRTMCHIEWRMLIKLRSRCKWLLWRLVTIPMRWMILIGLFPKSTDIACCGFSNMFWRFWVVSTVLLHSKWATRSSCISRLPWRSGCGHDLGTKLGVNHCRCKMWYRINQSMVE